MLQAVLEGWACGTGCPQVGAGPQVPKSLEELQQKEVWWAVGTVASSKTQEHPPSMWGVTGNSFKNTERSVLFKYVVFKGLNKLHLGWLFLYPYE